MKKEFDHTWFEVNFEAEGAKFDIAQLCAGTMWFFEPPIHEIEDEFFATFDILSEPVKPTANWWKNYDMGEFKPVSSRTFGLPKKWIKTPDRDRSFWAMEAKHRYAVADRLVYYATHHRESPVWDSTHNHIRQVLPWRLCQTEPESLLERVVEVGNILPFHCGHAGYAIEVSRQFNVLAHRTVFPKPRAESHAGVTLAWDEGEWRLKLFPGVDQVNWLTMVGEVPLEALGGTDALHKALDGTEVTVHKVNHGVVLQAGPHPVCGAFIGEDLQPYRDVWAALRTQIEPHTEWRGFFSLGLPDEKGEKKRQWYYTRLA